MESSFPTTRCEHCDKTVLTYVVLDEQGEECRRCVDCESPVSKAIEWATADEVRSHGYDFGAVADGRDTCENNGGCNGCSIRKN
jgi:NAD-dependent SIR2 family protein deacetylase